MKIGGEHGVSRVLSQQQERFDKLKNIRMTSTQYLFDDVIADTSHDGEETLHTSLRMEDGLEKVTNASIKGVVRLSKRYFGNRTKFCHLHDFNGTFELNTPCVASSIAKKRQDLHLSDKRRRFRIRLHQPIGLLYK